MTDANRDDLEAAWAAATAPTPEIVWPDYADDDPDRISVDGIPEPPAVRAARKRVEAAAAVAQAKLIKRLEADPTSDEGTISYAPGQSPDELAAVAAELALNPKLTPITELEQIELDNGFIFGGGPKPAPTSALVCTNPACARNGEHVGITLDSILPIRCGECSTVLLCNHTPQTTDTTTGTLAAPVRTITTRCTLCGDTLNETREQLPPISLTDLPVEILNTISNTPGDTTFQPDASATE